MGAKKKAVANKLAVAQPAVKSLATINTNIENVLVNFAESVAVAKLEELPTAYRLAKRAVGALEALEATIKTNLIAAVQQQGQAITEKGSKEMLVGKHSIAISPTRTGFDGKKVEALCRAKGMDPAVMMDAVIVYKVNEGKQQDAIKRGALTEDEMETCRYEVNFKIHKCEEES